MLRGIDISQSNIDIVLPDCGVDFIVCKASQDDWEDVTFNGAGTVDRVRRFFLREARDAVPVIGAYHFLTSGDGKEQALTYVRVVKRANNAQLSGVLCVLVVEHDLRRKSKPDATHVVDFIAEFQRLSPRQPLWILTNAPYWRSTVHLDLSPFDDVYVALEKWTDAKDFDRTLIPETWWDTTIGGRKPSAIQFTSQAFVGGARVSGWVYKGDLPSLKRLTDVGIPFTPNRRVPALPPNLAATPRFRPKRPNDTDDKAHPGRTTILTLGVVGGVLFLVGMLGFVAYGMSKNVAPVFDGDW